MQNDAATVAELKQLLELMKADALSFDYQGETGAERISATRRIGIGNCGRQRSQPTLEKEETGAEIYVGRTDTGGKGLHRRRRYGVESVSFTSAVGRQGLQGIMRFMKPLSNPV